MVCFEMGKLIACTLHVHSKSPRKIQAFLHNSLVMNFSDSPKNLQKLSVYGKFPL